MNKVWIASILACLMLLIPFNSVVGDSDVDFSKLNDSVVSQSDELPDFKIVNVGIGYHPKGWPTATISIKNLGGDVKWNFECKVTIKKLFQNKNLFSKTVKYSTSQWHLSGEIKTFFMKEFWMLGVPTIVFARMFFEVDPSNEVVESNEANNVVWAYVVGLYINMYRWAFCKLFLGRLRQQNPSNIDILEI